MLICILVLLIIAFVVSVKVFNKYKNRLSEGDQFFCKLLCVFFGAIMSILIIYICNLAQKVATESVIDSKIAMYQEENANIEQDIDKIVQKYLEHEHDTFDELKTEESSITLVTLFPELKSDSLVQQQLEIYVANNAKIKSLKEEKIDLAVIRWILYFGK